jgi:glycosyltransferase 2 family protein
VLLAAFSSALAVLAILTIAVSDQTFLAGEATALERVNDLPAILGWPLRRVMELGTLPVGLVVIVAMAFAVPSRGFAPVVAALLGVGAAYRLDNVWKALVERPRPTGLVDGLQVREHPGGFGFPSGHTTMAFALAALLHPMVPRRWRPLLWVLAVGVGLGRMHVGVHWPADVVGGAALGITIGSGATLIAISGLASRR